MTTFILLHGAGGRATDWDLVRAELTPRGHEVIAVDLPCDQEVGLAAYVDAVLDAIGNRRDKPVLVAQSLAGLIAPLVAARIPIEMIVLLAAMVPDRARPAATGGPTPATMLRSPPRDCAMTPPRRCSSMTCPPRYSPPSNPLGPRRRPCSRNRGRLMPGLTCRPASSSAAATASSLRRGCAASSENVSTSSPSRSRVATLPT